MKKRLTFVGGYILLLIVISCCSFHRKKYNVIDEDRNRQGMWFISSSDSLVICRYKNDFLKGKYLTYDKDGFLKIKGKYYNNQRISCWKFYHKGVIVSKIHYNKKGRTNRLFIRNMKW